MKERQQYVMTFLDDLEMMSDSGEFGLTPGWVIAK